MTLLQSPPSGMVDLHAVAWPTGGGRSPSEDTSVAILRWPAEAHLRADLRGAGRPCFWLLDAWELPPELGHLEDWARVPIDDRDLAARVERLAARMEGGAALRPGEVRVDDGGMLCHRGHRLLVPPLEAALLNRLGRTPQRVVTREQLAEVLWPGQARSPRAIDSRLHVLRARIAPLGLAIHTVRGRGFLLGPGPSSPGARAG